MAWQIDGTFLRINTDFQASPGGELWSQDLSASIKIIASRHDFHDEDMALGIAATLNLDGLNQMRAELNAGAFKVANAAPASIATDLTRYDQIIKTAGYDSGTGLLTLSPTTGPDVTVTINAAVGTGGTLTQVDIGEGLDGTTDPIISTGDIKLETIGTPLTETNGIQSITVDKHGRVTQVVGGAFETGGTVSDLSISIDSASVTINNTGGQDVIIPAAVAGVNAGVMTAAMAQQLQDFVAGADMKPPIVLSGVRSSIVPSINFGNNADSVSVNTVGNVWTPVLSYTGEGVIDLMSIDQALNTGNFSAGARLMIDGINVWQSASNAWDNAADDNMGFVLVGITASSGISSGVMKFNTSFSLEIFSTTSGITLRTYTRYQAWS